MADDETEAKEEAERLLPFCTCLTGTFEPDASRHSSVCIIALRPAVAARLAELKRALAEAAAAIHEDCHPVQHMELCIRLNRVLAGKGDSDG